LLVTIICCSFLLFISSLQRFVNTVLWRSVCTPSHRVESVGPTCHRERNEANSGGIGVPPIVIPAYAGIQHQQGRWCLRFGSGGRPCPPFPGPRIGVRGDERPATPSSKRGGLPMGSRSLRDAEFHSCNDSMARVLGLVHYWAGRPGAL
jgi:hypothetical protein